MDSIRVIQHSDTSPIGISTENTADIHPITMNPPKTIAPKTVPMESIDLLANHRIYQPRSNANSQKSEEDDGGGGDDDSDDDIGDEEDIMVDDVKTNPTGTHLPSPSGIKPGGFVPPPPNGVGYIRQQPPPATRAFPEMIPPAGTSNGGGGMGNIFSSFFNKNNAPDSEDNEDIISVRSGTSGIRTTPPRMEDLMQKKQDLLYKLERLEKSGYKAVRKYTLSNTLEELQFEYNRMKKMRDTDKSIRFSRKMLMAFTSGVEFLNDKFDPLDIRLDGWSESVMENIEDYDDVFEELYEKYKNKIKMAPELQLLWLMGSSAFMFHLTNSLFGSNNRGIVKEMLKKNPNLAQNLQQAAMNTMRSRVSEDLNKEEIEAETARMRGQSQRREINENTRMKGPSGVDDLLSGLRNSTPTYRPREQDMNDDDEIIDDDEEDGIFSRPTVQISSHM